MIHAPYRVILRWGIFRISPHGENYLAVRFLTSLSFSVWGSVGHYFTPLIILWPPTSLLIERPNLSPADIAGDISAHLFHCRRDDALRCGIASSISSTFIYIYVVPCKPPPGCLAGVNFHQHALILQRVRSSTKWYLHTLLSSFTTAVLRVQDYTKPPCTHALRQ
jgi:hypothetical protein